MTTVIECRPRAVEKPTLDLQALVPIIGPRFAEGAAERDAGDVFVAEHYDMLKHHRVFSALVPADLGGGGLRHSSMCTFLRQLAHYCPSTALALSMHQHLVAAAAYNHRQGRPGKKLLERVAADEAVLISTGANDWMESSGAAERADGGFRISAKSRSAAVHQRATCWSHRLRSSIQKKAGRLSILPFPSPLPACRSLTTGGHLACVPPARRRSSSTTSLSQTTLSR